MRIKNLEEDAYTQGFVIPIRRNDNEKNPSFFSAHQSPVSLEPTGSPVHPPALSYKGTFMTKRVGEFDHTGPNTRVRRDEQPANPPAGGSRPQQREPSVRSRNWSDWLTTMQALRAEMQATRAGWSRSLAGHLPPVELLKAIQGKALQSLIAQSDVRALLRQLVEMGRVSKCWSVVAADLLSELPLSLRVQASWDQYLALKDRGGQLNPGFSQFVCQRMALADLHWDQSDIQTGVSPSWLNPLARPPIYRPQSEVDSSRLAPILLQELDVDAHTELDDATVELLASCKNLHTVRLRSTGLQGPATLNYDASWLERLPGLETLIVGFVCDNIAWIPESTRNQLKHLSLECFLYAPGAKPELDALPAGIELEICSGSDLGEHGDALTLSSRITGFFANPMCPTRENLIAALPTTLKKLRLVAFDDPLQQALTRFPELIELEVLPFPGAKLGQLLGLISGPSELRSLSARFDSNLAENAITALLNNTSLQDFEISITTQRGRQLLVRLIGCHPMKRLKVYLSEKQSTAESLAALVQALGSNRSLETFCIQCRVGLTPQLREAVSGFEPQGSLQDFSVIFNDAVLHRRSLRFWQASEPAPADTTVEPGQAARPPLKRRPRKLNS